MKLFYTKNENQVSNSYELLCRFFSSFFPQTWKEIYFDLRLIVAFWEMIQVKRFFQICSIYLISKKKIGFLSENTWIHKRSSYLLKKVIALSQTKVNETTSQQQWTK